MGNAEPVSKKEQKPPLNEIPINRQPMLEGGLEKERVRIPNIPKSEKKKDFSALVGKKDEIVSFKEFEEVMEKKDYLNKEHGLIVSADSKYYTVTGLGKEQKFKRTEEGFNKLQEYMKKEYGADVFDQFTKWTNEQLQKLNEQKKSQPKGGSQTKKEGEKAQDREERKRRKGEYEKTKGIAEKHRPKTGMEESLEKDGKASENKAEQVQKQKPPEEKKDAPATDFFTKSKQD
ncbi:MAG: hypothetical protein QME58_04090 [Bacteroidota bacterium]|nr:hypothetical protein [Bacteroidota bacterium]